MYLQKVDHFKDIQWVEGVSYGDVYMRNEQEQAAYAFEHSTTDQLFEQFLHCESESQKLSEQGLHFLPMNSASRVHIFSIYSMREASSLLRTAHSTFRRVRTLALGAANAWNQPSEGAK